MQEKKISLLDLILIILEKKKFFIISMLLFSISGPTISCLLPKHFTATAIVLPPKQPMYSSLGSLIGDLPISGLLKNFNFSGSGEKDQFLSILESRRLAEEIINKFDLERYYGFKKKPNSKYYFEAVLREYNKNAKIAEDKLGNITIAVTDTSPRLATDMANFIAQELDRISYDISRESAKNSKEFFSERLALIKADMDSAVKKFTEFKIKNNYIDLDQQVVSTIDAFSKLESTKLAVDLEIQQLKSKFGSANPRVVELEQEKSVIENRINYYMDTGGGKLIIALKDAPEKGVEYAYLYRDVKVQESLYQFAIQMFEQAKFKEADNTPIVQVLEWAKVPQKKTRPKRSVICLLFFFSGLVLTTTYILIDKWYTNEKVHATETYEKLQILRRHLLIKR